MIRDILNYKHCLDLEALLEDMELCVIELTSMEHNVVICSIYRAPNSDEKAFISKYARLLQQLDLLKKNGKHVIICTDHNFDFLKSDTHVKTRELVELNVDNHMWPVIMKPTRITKKSATLIDNIIVSNSIYKDYECGIILDDLSDHLPCYLVSRNLKL